MKTYTALTVVLVTLPLLTSPWCVAADSIRHSSEAAHHSGQSVGYGAAGSLVVTSAVAAVPLAASAATAAASEGVADALEPSPKGICCTPLPITDEVITVGPPPGQALGSQEPRQ